MKSERWRRWLGFDVAQAVQTGPGYALWAETYPPYPHNAVMQTEQAVVGPILADIRADRALDVGTGTGRYLPLLWQTGAHVVVGVDMSFAMLSRCDGSAPRICADAARLPFANGSFDLVCSSLMLGDVRDVCAWVAEASRVLAPGGHLVYSDFHPAWSDRGWRRTFRAADGRQFELGYFAHSIDDHLDQLARFGMHVRTIREPKVTGRPDPVVAVFHAVKDGIAPYRPRRPRYVAANVTASLHAR